MERIITLLREKNHYLEKFHDVNETELQRFTTGNFDHVESFYTTRDKILDLIRIIDDLIEDENAKCAGYPQCTLTMKLEAESLLRLKDEWVGKILSQDLQVISAVEKEKSNIIRELQAVKKGRKAMKGYHSGEVSRQLDEEA